MAKAPYLLVTSATRPTPGADGSATTGTPGVSQIVNTVIVGDGATREWAVEHGLETILPGVQVFRETAGETLEPALTLVNNVEVLDAERVKVVFSTAPAAGVVYWVQIDG